MLNKIILQGRLVRDPDVKQTASGIDIANITIAVDRDYKNGEDREADFIDVTAFRGGAQFIQKYFSKGRMILIVGRLQVRKYTDKDGNNRTKTDVVAENVYFGDSKTDSKPSNNYAALPEDDGDMPF